MKNLFFPHFLQKFDQYLLVNYPIVWETKIHFILFYSFLVINPLLFLAGFTSYMNAYYVPNMADIMRFYSTYPAGIGLLALVFYGFYQNRFQTHFKHYTFSQIAIRLGVICVVMLTIVSHVVMIPMGTYTYIHTRYDLEEVRQDLRYIRKMEVAEMLMARFYHLQAPEKNKMFENLQKSHFNQYKGVEEMKFAMDKLNDFCEIETKKLRSYSNVVSFCGTPNEAHNEIEKSETEIKQLRINIINEYNAQNPKNQIDTTKLPREYQGENLRGENVKELAIIKEHYESKNEILKRNALKAMYHNHIKKYIKNPSNVERLLNDNVLELLKDVKDLPFVLETKKVAEILAKYPKGREFSYQFNPKYQNEDFHNPKVANYHSIKNLENILTFGIQKNIFCSPHEALEKQRRQYEYENATAITTLRKENDRLDIDEENYNKAFSTQGVTNLIAGLYHKHFEAINTPNKFYKTFITAQETYYTKYDRVSLVMAGVIVFIFMALVTLWSKLYDFKNLLTSFVVVVIFFMVILFTPSLQNGNPFFIHLFNNDVITMFNVFAVLGAIGLIGLANSTYRNMVYTQKTLFWLICGANFLFVLNAMRLLVVMESLRNEFFVWANILLFGGFAGLLFGLYVFANHFLRMPFKK